MRKIAVFLLFIVSGFLMAQNPSKTALLLIDIQDFYFPGGRSALVEPELAAQNAALLLENFRSRKQLVVHIKHQAEVGSDIYHLVEPLASEKVIVKREVNSFLNTDLLFYLKENQIDTVVLSGMQTHMCLEAATRAAHDFGFVVFVIADACATKDLSYKGTIIPAKDVHLSTLQTLQVYAKILDTYQFLASK